MFKEKPSFERGRSSSKYDCETEQLQLSDGRVYDWYIVEEGLPAFEQWRRVDRDRPSARNYDTIADYLDECVAPASPDQSAIHQQASAVRRAAQRRARLARQYQTAANSLSDRIVQQLYEVACALLAYRSRRGNRAPSADQQNSFLHLSLENLSREDSIEAEWLRALAFPSYETQHFQPSYPHTFGNFLLHLLDQGKADAYDVQSRVVDYVEFVRSLLRARDDQRYLQTASWTRDDVVRHVARCSIPDAMQDEIE